MYRDKAQWSFVELQIWALWNVISLTKFTYPGNKSGQEASWSCEKQHSRSETLSPLSCWNESASCKIQHKCCFPTFSHAPRRWVVRSFWWRHRQKLPSLHYRKRETTQWMVFAVIALEEIRSSYCFWTNKGKDVQTVSWITAHTINYRWESDHMHLRQWTISNVRLILTWLSCGTHWEPVERVVRFIVSAEITSKLCVLVPQVNSSEVKGHRNSHQSSPHPAALQRAKYWYL